MSKTITVDDVTPAYLAYLISIGMPPRDAERLREMVQRAAREQVREIVRNEVQRRFIQGERTSRGVSMPGGLP